jgi:hypothetical protein
MLATSTIVTMLTVTVLFAAILVTLENLVLWADAVPRWCLWTILWACCDLAWLVQACRHFAVFFVEEDGKSDGSMWRDNRWTRIGLNGSSWGESHTVATQRSLWCLCLLADGTDCIVPLLHSTISSSPAPHKCEVYDSIACYKVWDYNSWTSEVKGLIASP